MASVSISVSLAQAKGIVTSSAGVAFARGTSAPGAGAIELRVDNAVGLRKQDVVVALDALKAAVMANPTIVS